jgi:hypothetical protein
MYGVVFLHDAPETGARKLVSTPEAIEAETPEDAKTEGRQILTELAPEHRSVTKPLSIVEISDEMKFGLTGCERVFLTAEEDGEELEFVDVTGTAYWSSQAWWHR